MSESSGRSADPRRRVVRKSELDVNGACEPSLSTSSASFVLQARILEDQKTCPQAVKG